MFDFIARRMIRSVAQRYDYDASYLLFLLEHSPKAFRKFIRATAMSRHREHAPQQASHTVALVATLREDCGPCTQMLVHLARQAHMPAEQIEAVLTHNVNAMNADVALAYRYARAILEKSADAADAREAVRARWGESALIDLAVAMLGSRLYPMMKQAIGYAHGCERIKLEGRWILARPIA